jgi:hypothetical protein
MLARFHGRSEAEVAALSVRDYLEFKAPLGEHRPTAYTLWLLGGILDCFLKEDFAEAEARAWLALQSFDQASCDKGSWLMAWELLWEERPPPFAAFASRPRHFEAGEVPGSRWTEPRWLEVAQAHLREIDNYTEAQKRLQARRSAAGKGKEGKGKSQTATAE